jgi:hypothetical protein
MKISYEINTAAIRKYIRETLEVMAEEAKEQAISAVPFRDGTLQSSIEVEMVDGENAFILSANAEHAAYVEFGTGWRGDASWTQATGEPDEVKPTYNTSGVVEILRHRGVQLDKPYMRKFNGQESQPFIRPQAVWFKNNVVDYLRRYLPGAE